MGVHTFRKGISLKVYARARLEIQLAYFKDAVEHISH